uniref:Uncharacterized protein n=1 Tax=Schistocephalus solidus TaxID=70667 RepID=A0A0X3PC17_SCHSO
MVTASCKYCNSCAPMTLIECSFIMAFSVNPKHPAKNTLVKAIASFSYRLFFGSHILDGGCWCKNFWLRRLKVHGTESKACLPVTNGFVRTEYLQHLKTAVFCQVMNWSPWLSFAMETG